MTVILVFICCGKLNKNFLTSKQHEKTSVACGDSLKNLQHTFSSLNKLWEWNIVFIWAFISKSLEQTKNSFHIQLKLYCWCVHPISLVVLTLLCHLTSVMLIYTTTDLTCYNVALCNKSFLNEALDNLWHWHEN